MSHTETARVAITLAAGGLLLFFGRKLFWLFVGVLGFASGFAFATSAFHGFSEIAILIAASFAGIIGVVLAIFLQKFAVGLAGFAAGAYLGFSVSQAAQLSHSSQLTWLIALASGIVGLFMMLILFGWALIVASSLLGASLITTAIPLLNAYSIFAIPVLAFIGILTQAGSRRSRPSED